jgi:hypothetical protein
MGGHTQRKRGSQVREVETFFYPFNFLRFSSCAQGTCTLKVF